MDLQKIATDYGISVDEVRQRWLALRVAYWKSDFKIFAKDVVRIRTKAGDLEPLTLNAGQDILHNAAEKMLREEGWVRLAGLKGRRQGFSTYVAARGYWRASLWNRQKIYILSHEMSSSNTLFDMVELMQTNHPFPPAIGADNAKELEFVKLGSSYGVATAGQKAGGRGGGTSYFHGSEVAWWTSAPDHFAASVQAVDEVRGKLGVLWERPARPLPFEQRAPEQIIGWVRAPSEIWLETTSAGPSGEFYTRYMDAMKGIGRYRHVFVPWTVQPEYTEAGDFTPNREPDEDGELPEGEYQRLYHLTDAQMLWRRSKIHELGSIGKFRQEYPIDVTEAFSAANSDGIFIKSSIILRARKREYEMPDAPLIIGVDPAGAGGDRFAVVWRRGDKTFRVEHRHKLEHDEAVAWLSSIIDEWQPAKMCIDRGSMGANIISSLRALGPRYSAVLKGVDFGGTSKAKLANPKRAGPWNIRAEIWGRMRDWLIEGGQIPDEDDLASDLAGPKIKYRANNDWLLESKTEMKSRGIRSSDLADALALTFAVTEFFTEWSKPKQQTGWQVGYNGGPPLTDTYQSPQFVGNPNAWMR
jgi:hypothetical protein